MKTAYPAVLTPAKEGGYVIRIPDLDIATQGETVAEAIDMARDAASLWAISMQDLGEEVPEAESFTLPHKRNEIVALIDVDFDEYRKMHDMRSIRKNVTIPAYLEYAAEQAGINFSRVLQDALKKELGLL